MNQLCGIAIGRLGLTSREFYQLTPIEFDWALKDHENTYFGPVKIVCETLRVVAQIIYNSAYGQRRGDVIRDPQKLIRFAWESPKIQSVEEMRGIIEGLAHMKGVKVEQKEVNK